jgi:hypothetical protein
VGYKGRQTFFDMVSYHIYGNARSTYTSGTNKNVKFMERPITIDNPLWRNSLNTLENTLNVILDQGLKIAVAWGNPSATGKPRRYQMFLRKASEAAQ